MIFIPLCLFYVITSKCVVRTDVLLCKKAIMLNKQQILLSISKLMFVTGTRTTAKALRVATHERKQLSLLQLACAVWLAKNRYLLFGVLQGKN